MGIKDYIINKIDELSLKMKESYISVRYAYEKSTDFHVIEVSPETIRRKNEEYIKWEVSVWKEFAELFPNEDLVISEPTDLNDMANLIYSYNSLNSITFKQYNLKVEKVFNSKFNFDIPYNDYALAA